MKKVAVLIREAPLATVRTSEALRMAVGLTLSDHQVHVLYLGDGAYAALDLKPEAVAQPGTQQSLELFEGMKVRQWVERQSLAPWALPLLRKGVEVKDRADILALLRRVEAVIPF